MIDVVRDAPQVKIFPPLVYLAGLVIGFFANLWLPVKFMPDMLAWTIGGILIICGAVLANSAFFKFKRARTTVRPDRPPSALVIAGPYKFTRNPMYVGLAVTYLGIATAGQSVWALILLPVVLAIIQRKVIEPEEAFLKRHFGGDYIEYTKRVRRWV